MTTCKPGGHSSADSAAGSAAVGAVTIRPANARAVFEAATAFRSDQVMPIPWRSGP